MADTNSEMIRLSDTITALHRQLAEKDAQLRAANEQIDLVQSQLAHQKEENSSLSGDVSRLQAELAQQRATDIEREQAAWERGRKSAYDHYQADLAEARRDSVRIDALQEFYEVAHFNPPEMDLGEGIALIFLLPKGSTVNASLRGTIDAAIADQQSADKRGEGV